MCKMVLRPNLRRHLQFTLFVFAHSAREISNFLLLLFFSKGKKWTGKVNVIDPFWKCHVPGPGTATVLWCFQVTALLPGIIFFLGRNKWSMCQKTGLFCYVSIKQYKSNQLLTYLKLIGYEQNNDNFRGFYQLCRQFISHLAILFL